MDRAAARCYLATMSDLSLTILAETANDAQAIEAIVVLDDLGAGRCLAPLPR